MLAIKGGKIYTITNGVIDRGTVLIDGGKIVKVGKKIKIPDDAEIIDISGKIVMPGLVEAHCHIGISEETIGWAGSDGNERTDPATPNMRALDGIKANADEKGLEAALKEGITTAARARMLKKEIKELLPPQQEIMDSQSPLPLRCSELNLRFV